MVTMAAPTIYTVSLLAQVLFFLFFFVVGGVGSVVLELHGHVVGYCNNME